MWPFSKSTEDYREERERYERDASVAEAKTEAHRGVLKEYQRIARRGGLGTLEERDSFLGSVFSRDFLGEREDRKPRGIWAAFKWDMERSFDDEEVQEKILRKYVNILAHGIGGFTEKEARERLQRIWRKHQQETLEEDLDLGGY